LTDWSQNDIDYALMQLHHQRGPSTPATADVSTRALMSVANAPSDPQAPRMPPRGLVLLRLLLHILILALSVFSLVTLFERAPIAAFAVFLVWTAVFYVALVALAWRGLPKDSALTVLLDWFRGSHPARYTTSGTPGPSRPLSANGVDYASEPRGPYLHQQLYRAAADDGAPVLYAHGGDEADSDEDEDTRQRRIEDQMARRDVSIVTVPKRKLWITNPS
jgi:hypothetical protein